MLRLFPLRNKTTCAKAPFVIEWNRGWGKKIQYFPLMKPDFSHSEMPGKWLMKPESLEKGTKYLNNSSMFGTLAAKMPFPSKLLL